MMMALGDVVFTFCDTCTAKSECSVVIIGVLSFIIFLLAVQHQRVKACRLETKVLNCVRKEDIMKCNIIIGISISVCKFRTSPTVCSSLYCHWYGSRERGQFFAK